MLSSLLLFQLHPFLGNTQFYNSSMDRVYLDENGELAADLDIVNWVVFPNKSVLRVKFGSIDRQGSPDLKCSIDQEAIVWPKWLNQVTGSGNDACHFAVFSMSSNKCSLFCGLLPSLACQLQHWAVVPDSSYSSSAQLGAKGGFLLNCVHEEGGGFLAFLLLHVFYR